MIEDADTRRRELAAIHIAKSQLAMADDVYRQLLWAIARVTSARDLDSGGRKRLLDHMKACGFKTTRPRAPKPGRPRPPADRIPMVAKIRAILAEAGRPDGYADGIAMKMFGVERYEWLPPDQMHRLVSALVYDQQRRAAKAQA